MEIWQIKMEIWQRKNDDMANKQGKHQTNPYGKVTKPDKCPKTLSCFPHTPIEPIPSKKKFRWILQLGISDGLFSRTYQ